MHKTFTAIQQQLKNVVAQIEAKIPNDEPLGIAHNNWSFPGLTRVELIEEAQSIIDLITDQGSDDIGEHDAKLIDYLRRLQHLQKQTVPQLWGNAAQAVPAYLFTLNGLRKALLPVLSQDGNTEAATKLRILARQLRAMESRLNGLEPRTTTLTAMVERIENAHNAADQLPTDLESLTEARQQMTQLVQDAIKDKGHLLSVREQANNIETQLKNCVVNANTALERCETAYSASTSVGLAAAFSERSSSLSKSMWLWVSGLIAALAGGSYFGSSQLQSLSKLFQAPDTSTAVIVLNLLLSLLSVGAPIWFAWLATKQIGQRFRLAEDYAFKASVSRAYEGFRRETARFDKDMEARLLNSALSRFDELPLRLVDPDSHGSPWHELATSDTVKQAMKAVPGFAEQVKDLASQTVSAINLVRKTKPAKTSDDE